MEEKFTTINELRAIFNLPPIVGGDKLVTQCLTIGNKKWLEPDPIFEFEVLENRHQYPKSQVISTGKFVSKPKRMLRIVK